MATSSEARSALPAHLGKLFPEIQQLREELHRHPELSWKEHQTTRRIAGFARAAGLPPLQQIYDTGGIIDRVYRRGAPFILLRADIDALPVRDDKTCSYRSQTEGVCHACGHDAHSAIVLGTAALLEAAGVDLPFNVRYIFQPAEETIPSGAPEFIKRNVLDQAATVLGIHMEPRLQLGVIGLTPGYVNMQSIRLDISIAGDGGHSARPNETSDLIWVASRLVQDSYQLIYREINMLDSPVVLTFTQISAGQGYNVIPDQLQLTGTLRLSDPGKKKIFWEKFERLIAHYQSETGCRIKLEVTEGAPAIYNHPALIDQLASTLESDFPAPVRIETNFRTPGGDDFSHYCQDIPGAMVRIGVGTPEMQASLHEGSFDVHPEALRLGVLACSWFLAGLQLPIATTG